MAFGGDGGDGTRASYASRGGVARRRDVCGDGDHDATEAAEAEAEEAAGDCGAGAARRTAGGARSRARSAVGCSRHSSGRGASGATGAEAAALEPPEDRDEEVDAAECGLACLLGASRAGLARGGVAGRRAAGAGRGCCVTRGGAGETALGEGAAGARGTMPAAAARSAHCITVALACSALSS